MGRRPELKFDEFSVFTPLVIEIQGVNTFSQQIVKIEIQGVNTFFELYPSSQVQETHVLRNSAGLHMQYLHMY